MCETSYLSPEMDILCHEWAISNCASGHDLSASALSCFRLETRHLSAFFGLVVFLLLGLCQSYSSYAVACVVKGSQIQIHVGNDSKVYKYLKSLPIKPPAEECCFVRRAGLCFARLPILKHRQTNSRFSQRPNQTPFVRRRPLSPKIKTKN